MSQNRRSADGDIHFGAATGHVLSKHRSGICTGKVYVKVLERAVGSHHVAIAIRRAE